MFGVRDASAGEACLRATTTSMIAQIVSTVSPVEKGTVAAVVAAAIAPLNLLSLYLPSCGTSLTRPTTTQLAAVTTRANITRRTMRGAMTALLATTAATVLVETVTMASAQIPAEIARLIAQLPDRPPSSEVSAAAVLGAAEDR